MTASHEIGHFQGLSSHSKRCVDVLSYYAVGGKKCNMRGNVPMPKNVYEYRSSLPTACDIERCRMANKPWPLIRTAQPKHGRVNEDSGLVGRQECPRSFRPRTSTVESVPPRYRYSQKLVLAQRLMILETSCACNETFTILATDATWTCNAFLPIMVGIKLTAANDWYKSLFATSDWTLRIGNENNWRQH